MQTRNRDFCQECQRHTLFVDGKCQGCFPQQKQWIGIVFVAVVILAILISPFAYFAVKNRVVGVVGGKSSETLTVTVTPLEVPGVHGKMIDGVWTYKCDVLNYFTWTGHLSFAYAEMDVRIFFDDANANSHEEPLAFIISSPKPEYKYSWLYTEPDGTFDPDLTYFNKYGPMEVYPGGYPAFEKELKDMNIDWRNMYLRAKAEFLQMYLTMDTDQCFGSKQELIPPASF